MSAAAPWLSGYDPDVPPTIGAYPDRTLVDFVREHAALRPAAPALRFKGRTVTWADLERQSDALARAYVARGVAPGDRVALLLPNCPQFVIAELAAWKAGAVVAPVNPVYTDRELEHALALSGARLAVVLTPFYARVKAVQPKTALRHVVATRIREFLPPLLAVLFRLFREKKDGHSARLVPGDEWLPALLAEGARADTALPGPRPDAPAALLMSGGTTGTPKAVVTEHRGLVAAGLQITAWLRAAVAEAGSSVLLPLPLFHAYGLAGAQPAAMVNGIPLVLVPDPRDLDDLLAVIRRERPTLFCGVPTLFVALLDHPAVRAGRVDFGCVVAAFSGAAALMAETKARFERLTGGRIVEGYSLTEATLAACVTPLRGPSRPGSVGLPLPDVLVRIVDPEDPERDVAPGEVGEIALSAPQIMTGYWNDPAETALVLREGPDGRRWLRTGDLGRLDADGFLYLVDRKKDVIKTRGYQVWPREVEEVIAAHPSVAEVGVAGVPDEKKSEAVAAWVVLRPGAERPDAEALRAWCRERLAPFKVPSRIEIRDALPKTLVGKVLRRALVEEARCSSR